MGKNGTHCQFGNENLFPLFARCICFEAVDFYWICAVSRVCAANSVIAVTASVPAWEDCPIQCLFACDFVNMQVHFCVRPRVRRS